MSAASTYVLFCDTPGCEEIYLAHEAADRASTPRRLATVRESAHGAGWESRVLEPGPGHQFARTVDTCPICHAEAAR